MRIWYKQIMGGRHESRRNGGKSIYTRGLRRMNGNLDPAESIKTLKEKRIRHDNVIIIITQYSVPRW